MPDLVVRRALTTRIDCRCLPGLGNSIPLDAHPGSTADIQFYGVQMKYHRAHAYVTACTPSALVPPVSEEATAERFLRLPEVMSTCGLARSSIYEKVANGDFPQPVRLTRCCVAWVDSEIRQWMAARIAARQS
ncbi:AlpA family transcriptional regulator [Ralstonia solanacearum]|uniref:AlpA family transcriptional regulator n=2 Tax=Ralstonia solanacearum TaxID=305 RepID=UPI001E334C8A|nr:AlpA family transcriptional regulator [Ralstonia solanacearum]